MKNKTLEYTVLSLILSISWTVAGTTTDDDFADKYYQRFESSDGNSQIGASIFFFKEVPASSQAEVLADILDRAVAAKPQNQLVIVNVIDILRGYQGPITWNAHLEKSVLAQAKSPDPTVRKLLVIMLAIARRDQNRDLVLSFQNDPDEVVRYSAIHAIVKWPDAEAIYQKFIQDHQFDPHYAKTVLAAQNHINTVHEMQHSDGK